MQEITIDVLLEFLYDRFAVTFIFCLVGSFIRETLKPSSYKKDIKSKFMDGKRLIMSSIFSTFLVCACVDYIELQFGTYIILCIMCGMWGLSLGNMAVSGKFMNTLLSTFSKKIANPIVKSVVESASKELEEQQKEDKEEETKKE